MDYFESDPKNTRSAPTSPMSPSFFQNASMSPLKISSLFPDPSPTTKYMRQPFNQSLNQSFNQSFGLPFNQSMNQPFNDTMDQPLNYSTLSHNNTFYTSAQGSPYIPQQQPFTPGGPLTTSQLQPSHVTPVSQKISSRKLSSTSTMQTPSSISPNQKKQQQSNTQNKKSTMMAPDLTQVTKSPTSLSGWQHPAVEIISTRYKTAKQFVYQQIVLNVVVFVCIAILLTSGPPESFSPILNRSSTNFLYYLRLSGYLSLILIALNIANSFRNYFAPDDQFGDFALSPKQRKLLGLDPNASTWKPGSKRGLQVTSSPLPPSSMKSLRPISPVASRHQPQQDGNRSPPVTSPTRAFHPAYSVSSHGEELATLISDQDNLKKFIDKEQENYIKFRKQANRPLFPFGAPLGRYQNAIGAPQPEVPTTIKGINPLETQLARELLTSLDIQDFIDQWTENLRKWLATRVIQPLNKRIERVEREFENNGLFHLKLSAPPNSQPYGTQNLAELIKNHGNNPLVQERVKLEKYFNIPNTSSRRYIIERIKVLSGDDLLAKYLWNSSGSSSNKNSNNEHPTDALLMMYLFIHFMDEMLVAEDPVPNKGYPFSSIYFQKTSQQIEFQTFQPDILIREISVSPSHFNLMVNKKSWAVAPGRSNVFHTLILFLYFIKVEKSSYLGTLNLGGRYLDLIPQVFDY